MLKHAQELRLKVCKRLNQRTARCSAFAAAEDIPAFHFMTVTTLLGPRTSLPPSGRLPFVKCLIFAFALTHDSQKGFRTCV